MDEKGNWYLLYTRVGREKRMVEIFTRKKIEHYWPVNRIIRDAGDRKRVVYEPLLNYRIFIRVSQWKLEQIKMMEGVVSIVCWMGNPAIIADADIDTIKDFLNRHTNVQLEKTALCASGDLAVTKDSDGLQSISKVLLPSLGLCMVAEREKEELREPLSVNVRNRYDLLHSLYKKPSTVS